MFAVFAISLLAGLLFTPLVIALARRIGFYDRPSAINWHHSPTPLLGGLSILGAMLAGMLVGAPDAKTLLAIATSASLAALAGLADDIKRTRPVVKLLALSPAALVVLWLWPDGLAIFWWPAVVLFFLYLANSVNLLDNMDGITCGMSLVSAAAYGAMAIFGHGEDVGAWAFALCGASLAFLVFNYRVILPAAIFLGDMGTLAIGATLCLISIRVVQLAETTADCIVVFLPVGVVMTDTLLTTYIRYRQGLPILGRSEEHISQRLCRAGVPRWQVVLIMMLFTLISSVAAVLVWVTTSAVLEGIGIAVGLGAIGYLAVYSYNLALPPEGSPLYRERTICRIITRLDVGGPPQHCVYLANTLKKMGWQTYLLHGNIDPQAESSMEYLAEREGVDTYRIPTLKREVNPLADLRALWQLYGMIRRLRPQIVHTHHAKAGTLGRIAAALCDVPIVVHTFHGISLRGYFGPIKNNVFLRIEKICAPVSSVLVTIGPNDRKELIALGVAPAEKFVTIPLGLSLQRFADTEPYKGTLRKGLGIGKDQRLIVYIGRMVPIKNVVSFIDMAAAVVQQRDDVKFLLVGDGPLREELEQQVADLGITNSVTFYGVTDQMEKIYAEADLVVLCSKREGMPVVMLEALAAGRPVVCTDVGNVRSFIFDGETGRLVPPEDTSALTQAVLAALDDIEGSRRMAKAGQRHVLESFPLGTLTERLDALYNALTCQAEYVDPVAPPALGAVVRQSQELS